MSDDMEYAATTIGLMLRVLKDRYSDAQIMKMLSKRKVSGMLKVVSETIKNE